MPNVIPLPRKSEERYGEFILNSTTAVYADEQLGGAEGFLISIVEKACGYKLDTVYSKKAAVRFLYERKIPDEGYRIECDSENIVVYASGFAGAFYAVQTLRQLLNADIMENAKVLTMHAVVIEDSPRYRWRGVMLDESRHFFGPEFVKRLLGLMAINKLNVFHWHLADDVGWRIEVKKYPKLAETSSRRKGTQFLAAAKDDIEDIPYGDFYSQEEIKEIVAYAQKLNIAVVPEIPLPVNAGAAVAAYPELSCKEEPVETPVIHGSGAPLCAGKEFTYKFLYDVIDELCELFPAPYFHIGGNGAPKSEWESCAYCQKAAAKYGLNDGEGLLGLMVAKLSLYLKNKGKSLIGRNPILKVGALEASVTADDGAAEKDISAEEYLKDGRRLVVSKSRAFSFDMPYAYLNLKDTYGFEAARYGLTDTPSLLGVEGVLWTEWVRTPERAEYQLFPRLQALAETAWTPAPQKDYAGFRKRLKKFLPILNKACVNYAPESMLDAGSGGRIYRIFKNRDAHFEYKKAMLKGRRYK